MDFSIQPDSAAARAGAVSENATLRQACNEIEGMFISILLKQGLQPGTSDEENPGYTESIQEYAIEQTSRDIGQAGTLGIADAIYEELAADARPSVPAPLRSSKEGHPHAH